MGATGPRPLLAYRLGASSTRGILTRNWQGAIKERLEVGLDSGQVPCVVQCMKGGVIEEEHELSPSHEGYDHQRAADGMSDARFAGVLCQAGERPNRVDYRRQWPPLLRQRQPAAAETRGFGEIAH